MAALSDFRDVPAVKYLYIKDERSGKQAFFNFDAVVTKLEGIEYDITRLKNDVLKLKDRFDELDAALESIENALKMIQQIRKELLDAMSALRQEMRDEINRIDDILDGHKDKLAELQNKYEALNNAIKALEGRLDALNQELTALKQQTEKNTADIEKLNKKTTTIIQKIEVITNELKDLKQDLLDNYAKLKEKNTFTQANTFKSIVTIERKPVKDTDATNKKYVDTELAKALLPVGSIIAYAGSIVPDGYLLCDGTMVEKTVYPALYNVIQGIYGEDAQHFKLPDLRDRFIQGGSAPSATSQEPQLPNIMGNFTGFGDPSLSDGAFSSTISTASRGKVQKGETDGMLLTHFDASKYSPYYKNSATKIVPPSYVMMFLIKV